MQQGDGIVRQPTHKEENDDHHRDLGSPGLLLVEKEGGVADSVPQRRHNLGGGGASRGRPASGVKVDISQGVDKTTKLFNLPMGNTKRIQCLVDFLKVSLLVCRNESYKDIHE